MAELSRDLLGSLHPDTLWVIIVLGGIIWRYLNKQQKATEEKLDALEARMENRQKEQDERQEDQHRDAMKEILRMQILTGINESRLSASELSFFYDKYSSFGGNSFVTDKVHAYLSEIEEEEKKKHD